MPNEAHTKMQATGVGFAQRTAEFAGALLDPDVKIPHGIGKNDNPAPKRFSVYRNNVVVSLLEALGQAYPSVLAILGEENFKRVARNFIMSHPPGSAMMQSYGEAFAGFLERFPPLAKSPFLADVARAERAWLDAWHAPDHVPMDPSELAAIAPEDSMTLVLEPLPATRLIRSAFPVADLFNARNQWPTSGINLEDAQSLLITRPYLECIVTELDQAAADFSQALFGGVELGEAISTALENDEAFDASVAISTLFQSGALRSMKANTGDHHFRHLTSPDF